MNHKSIKRERLDTLLVEKDFFPSREKARREILAGNIFIDGIRFDKPGTPVLKDSNFEIKKPSNPYVGRGGLKLEKALKDFKIDVTLKTALDIGASTGGFTDCLLKHGIEKVFTIDVGYGQLAWELKINPKVISKERVNARYLKPDDFPCLFDIITIDVSFISLTKILESAKNLLSDNGQIIALIKPQFEAGKDKVGKGGIIKDEKVHKEVVEKIIDFANLIGMTNSGLIASPIFGMDGNKEFLILLKKG